ATLIRSEPQFFSRVLALGREFKNWNATTSKVFGERGGKRVAFGCFQDSCLESAMLRAQLIERYGASARAFEASEPLNVPSGLRLVEQDWSWLVAGDPRFELR